MVLLKAILRPDRLDAVRDALIDVGATGMTITEVRGHGSQKGHTAIYRGREYAVTLLPKMQIEVVIPDRLASDAVNAVSEAGKTGQIGDGRIFIMPGVESYKIRTGEVDLIA
jgi:nitrogen regulatory protein PII